MINLYYTPRPPKGVATNDLAWGDGILEVAGNEYWYQGDVHASALHWTWIELLEWLSTSWQALEHEETYPLDLSVPDPRGLPAACSKRWVNMAEADVDEQDETIFDFQLRHDMSQALRGVHLPPLWFVREGENCWVSTSMRSHLASWSQVGADLQQIGDTLACHLELSTESRATDAIRVWRRRHLQMAEAIQYRAGMTADEVESLEDLLPTAGSTVRETEYLAVARMSGSMPVPIKRDLLKRVAQIPKGDTTALDALEQKALAALQGIDLYYEQGYSLAIAMRKHLGAEGPVDPEHVLSELGVAIEPIALNEPRLEAMACWGEGHGPAIFLNERGRSTSSPEGRRATLAHELCHLLIDRHGSLPMAEVLGGRAPHWPEARANAFAAEFLLPRRIATRLVRDSATMTLAIEEMKATWGVSRHLAAWQVKNSKAAMSLVKTGSERQMLDRLTSRT